MTPKELLGVQAALVALASGDVTRTERFLQALASSGYSSADVKMPSLDDMLRHGMVDEPMPAGVEGLGAVAYVACDPKSRKVAIPRMDDDLCG